MGRGVAGAGLGPKGRGLQAQAAARAAQSLPLSTTFSSATGPTELQVWGGVRVEKGTRPRVGLGRPEVGTTVSDEQNLDIVAVEWGDAELGER